MKGSIISVQRDAAQNLVCSVRGVKHASARRLFPVELSDEAGLPNWTADCATSEKAMEKIGKRLFDALRNHPAIAEQLFGTVINEGRKSREPSPIYFDVDTSEDDEVPWEALLHESCGFVALDPRWPISRLQEPLGGESLAVNDFFYPLKFLVVLSSTAEEQALPAPNALEHWQALENTLRRAQTNLCERWSALENAALNVLVLSNDRSLKEAIEQSDLTAWVECNLIADERDLLDQLADYRPHFIHILCHGLAKGPRLILGTTKDYATGGGSIQLGPSHFSEREPITWLITLNACNSAKGAEGVHSFARSLVEVGIPAAVGMREAISTQQAALLCSDFYADVFDRVARIGIDGKAEEVDWAFALRGVRRKLLTVSHEKPLDDSCCRHWTIPVLYRTSESFTVRYRGMRADDKVELVKMLDELQKSREGLVKARKQFQHTESVDAAIADFDKRIAEIQEALKPKPKRKDAP